MNIVKAENISKQYIISHEKDALIRNILPYIFRRKYQERFWALKEVNFTLKKGESLGIIGPNGAGKSTLLNILAGIVTPTEGSVRVQGKVSSILTLGAGFHPELTGIENIYLNGSILGMTLKELKEKLDDIIKFSELHSFIDAPIQTYSTGMILRLGFSIAVHVDFDILLVDEILLVGDLYFQKKCISKMEEFRKNGKTLVISSQSLQLVKSLSDRMLLLSHGEIMSFGEPDSVIKQYENLNKIDRDMLLKKEALKIIKNKMTKEHHVNVDNSWGLKTGTGLAEIKHVKLYNRFGFERNEFGIGEQIRIDATFSAKNEIAKPHFGVAIFRDDRTYCYGPNTMFDGIRIDRLKPGVGKFSLQYHKFLLSPGEYYISVAIWDQEELMPYDYHCACYKFRVRGKEKALYWEPHRCRAERSQKTLRTNRDMERYPLVSLKDRYHEEKSVFLTGSCLNLSLDYGNTNKSDSPKSIRVFRDDGIFCFEIDSCFNKFGYNNTRKIFTVEIPELHLLPGNYYICFGEKKIREFTVFSDRLDHGVVYMPHRWNVKIP